MTTFPNAPASHSALFDNAPTVTASNMNTTADCSVTTASVPQTLTVHLTPAARICQDRGGRWMAVNVLMQYGAPIPLALALRRVQNGRTVFVAREDAKAVLESLQGAPVDPANLTGT